MTWIEDQIDNEEIFPTSVSEPFPKEFMDYIRAIYKRMYRVFAIIYHQHFEAIEAMDAAAHLNTCFKHFVFFILEFALLNDEQELAALATPYKRNKEQYEQQGQT